MNKTQTNNENEARPLEGLKQFFCGGVAGACAKTVTAPFSRLTILFQVHSMVTTKYNRPLFAMSLKGGMDKIVERGGILSLWKGNGTSVLHRFPFSAINFYAYEKMLDILVGATHPKEESIPTYKRFLAGACAGSMACIACYPLDLIRTRLTTELPGHENYKGITDAFAKIFKSDGPRGFYAGLGPTMFVAVPNFAISYTVYGSLKEYVLEDELFYNLRRIDNDSGEPMLGLRATLACGATSGLVSTLLTFPFDTVRRRMQIQSLHTSPENRKTGRQLFINFINEEGYIALYRGIKPELLKVIPMVGTMFFVYEYLKRELNVKSKR